MRIVFFFGGEAGRVVPTLTTTTSVRQGRPESPYRRMSLRPRVRGTDRQGYTNGGEHEKMME